MKNTTQFIFMADVIGSEAHPSRALGTHLKATTTTANRKFAEALRSPLTVTLGDEFQGLCTNLRAGIDLILWFEHQLRQKPLEVAKTAHPYALRYVLHAGQVDTPINPERAHGMLGPGLTHARRTLEAHRRGAPRIQVDLPDAQLASRLQNLFGVLTALTDDFKPADFTFIEALFATTDSEKLSRQFDRHRTSIERRRVTLKIDACLTLERLLRDHAD
ncbi:SatD family protein [Actomonas aquatica]|uniref:SatD family protein n=1 Tax=Actomonas aquatica TaxID=2866162 RepID=A0ABZ1CG33_9BACT|nr:SatD family protein [Opitutus sp. WL0086]WRQ89529.1 SatD family protein [Opitutus sp. WL0086]